MEASYCRTSYVLWILSSTNFGVKIWNKIPKEFKTLSKNSSNKQMKKSLFQILDNEDSYLDVENISSKLKDCIIKSN